jgi:uridine phosphorylase
MALSGIAVLTFNRGIVDRLEQICHLEDAEWISRCHHPYAAARLAKRGEFDGLDVIVLVPPMGASPLSCMIEDLVACGVQAVYLACAAWSLGPPVQFGDIIVPSFSLGPDGTSIHYGNDAGEVRASQRVVDALTEACRARGARHYVGGNAVCEALYRISPQMVADFRERGCLCMENGEASTLFAATQALEVIGGVLFQPYIDLQTGWDPARLDEIYRETCHLQAELVLEASLSLADQGLLSLEAQGSSSLADQGASSLAGQGLLGGGE